MTAIGVFQQLRATGDDQKHFLTVISDPIEKAKKNTLSHAPW
jgi:hypothetical protein